MPPGVFVNPVSVGVALSGGERVSEKVELDLAPSPMFVYMRTMQRDFSVSAAPTRSSPIYADIYPNGTPAHQPGPGKNSGWNPIPPIGIRPLLPDLGHRMQFHPHRHQ